MPKSEGISLQSYHTFKATRRPSHSYAIGVYRCSYLGAALVCLNYAYTEYEMVALLKILGMNELFQLFQTELLTTVTTHRSENARCTRRLR